MLGPVRGSLVVGMTQRIARAFQPCLVLATLLSTLWSATLITLFPGGPARGIVNRRMRELGPLNPAAPHSRSPRQLWRRGALTGSPWSGDFSPLWTGQKFDGCLDRCITAVGRAPRNRLA